MDLVPKPVYQPFAVGATVDTSSLLVALNLAARSTTRKMAKLLKDTALSTAFKWQNATPAMAQIWIDARMEVDVISYTNASRTRLSRNKRGTAFTKTPASPFLTKPVPLGVLIVMARHRSGSRWNQMTDNRWSLAGATLPGGPGSARARQDQIGAELTRMIRSRHSSTHFLQLGITDIIKELKRVGATAAGFTQRTAADSNHGRAQLGFVSTSALGPVQWVEIRNAIGTEGTPNLELRRQYYLFAVAGLSLEIALLEQVADMRTHYLPKVGAELALEWNSL